MNIILALDTTNLSEALDIANKIKSKIFTVKLGLEFFNAHGKEGVRKFNEIGINNLLLDLKILQLLYNLNLLTNLRPMQKSQCHLHH